MSIPTGTDDANSTSEPIGPEETETDGRYHKGVTECIVATLREIEETSGMVWLEAFSADIGPSTAWCPVCNRNINSNKDHPLP